MMELDYSQYGALALAYMGDCVYEIKIREHLMKQANMPVNMLHRKAKGYVSAAAQSAFMDKLLPLLTEEEESVFHRGRNAKPHTTPKNMTLTDYKKATGLESLMGFLYLSGKHDRINELMEIILEEDVK
ncbi:MAG: ribonuclease III domain-containing protein [Monoglobales bacterium]